MGKNLLQSPEFRGKASGRRTDRYDLTVRSDMRIVFLVAPNGSERSEMLGSRKHGANRTIECAWLVLCALGCVGVVCELDSVFVCFLCLFFVFECFWLGLLIGWFGWLVFLGFNVFVFVRRV